MKVLTLLLLVRKHFFSWDYIAVTLTRRFVLLVWSFTTTHSSFYAVPRKLGYAYSSRTISHPHTSLRVFLFFFLSYSVFFLYIYNAFTSLYVRCSPQTWVRQLKQNYQSSSHVLANLSSFSRISCLLAHKHITMFSTRTRLSYYLPRERKPK